MRYKYRVEILDENKEIIETWACKTKKEISEGYTLPLYIIDKIIKKTNDPTYPIKRDHLVYRDIMQQMRIQLIKPQLKF